MAKLGMLIALVGVVGGGLAASGAVSMPAPLGDLWIWTIVFIVGVGLAVLTRRPSD